ncbi:unnamed protein product, partial [Polarella glacialis]
AEAPAAQSTLGPALGIAGPLLAALPAGAWLSPRGSVMQMPGQSPRVLLVEPVTVLRQGAEKRAGDFLESLISGPLSTDPGSLISAGQ